MDFKSKLNRRRRLLKTLESFAEMLPGSFVESKVTCGKSSCRCSDGTNLHVHYVLSALIEGKPKTFHIPADLVEQVSRQVQMHKDFKEVERAICHLNLEFFLDRKETGKKRKD